jgi:prevent-host-death family protein
MTNDNSTMVGVHEAKTQLSKLLERVRGGEEIVIAKNGVPVARLCPIGPSPRRKPGILSGEVDERFFDPLPEDEVEAWEQ